MVNITLRSPGCDYARPEALVYPRTLGSALCHEWSLHFRHSAFAVPHDLLPAGIAVFYTGSVVADCRARRNRDADGAARIFDPALSRSPDQKSIPARPE